MAYKKTLAEYVNEFTGLMADRCEIKAIKYGSAWKNRPVMANGDYPHQNERFYSWLQLKMDAWRSGGEPVNWSDVANEAMICWVREEELKNSQPLTAQK